SFSLRTELRSLLNVQPTESQSLRWRLRSKPKATSKHIHTFLEPFEVVWTYSFNVFNIWTFNFVKCFDNFATFKM
ncbi:MAG: hypothetical protein ACTS6G_05225, partial [Candidatus Hodgkinia cicadicola]